jgi:hypothetical protein
MKKLCLFLVLAYSMTAAQTMYIRPVTGSQSSYPIANIQKLTFDNGNMLVTNTSGISDNFTLSELLYVNFTDVSLGTTNAKLSIDKFYAYPTPANHILNILASNAMQRVSQIKILSSEGRLLMQQKPATESPQVYRSALPQDVYLCKISSQNNQQQTIKFLRQ